jgi:hypothetical protein
MVRQSISMDGKTMSENIHETEVEKVRGCLENEFVSVTCGVWRYCHTESGGYILEQCGGCGEYRIREIQNMDVEIESK